MTEETRFVSPSLSPSRAADFMTCPLMYRFRTIDRLPEPPSPVMVRGTLVHAVLEDLFDVPAPERTLERAISMVPEHWRTLLADHPELSQLFDDDADAAGWLQSADIFLSTYFRLEDPRLLEPAERESKVHHVLDDGLALRGIIDRVDIAPDGRVRVVDYKTGKSPKPRYEDKALFQMKFYALVIWRTRGVIPTLLQLMYLGDGACLTYEPVETDLLAVEHKLQALWSAIAQAIERQEFKPRKGPLCNWCSFQSICPEFGGTPPALPHLELLSSS